MHGHICEFWLVFLGASLLVLLLLVLVVDLSVKDSIKLGRVVLVLCMVGEKSCGSTGCVSC